MGSLATSEIASRTAAQSAEALLFAYIRARMLQSPEDAPGRIPAPSILEKSTHPNRPASAILRESSALCLAPALCNSPYSLLLMSLIFLSLLDDFDCQTKLFSDLVARRTVQVRKHEYEHPPSYSPRLACTREAVLRNRRMFGSSFSSRLEQSDRHAGFVFHSIQAINTRFNRHPLQ